MDDEQKTAPDRRDGGYSLVEIAVAVALMAIIVVPMLMATTSLIKASATANASAELGRATSDAADRVTRAPTGCDYTRFAQAAALSRGWPKEDVAVSYQYLELNANPAMNGGSWTPPGSACPPGGRTPRLIQLVTITVTSPTGSSQTIQVVKSDV